MKRLFGLLLWSGLAAAALFAQAGGHISGMVSDPSGAAIPGAVVILKRSPRKVSALRGIGAGAELHASDRRRRDTAHIPGPARPSASCDGLLHSR